MTAIAACQVLTGCQFMFLEKAGEGWKWVIIHPSICVCFLHRASEYSSWDTWRLPESSDIAKTGDMVNDQESLRTVSTPRVSR